MGIEVMLYVYGAICISMIFFNCICIWVFRTSERRLERKSGRFERQMERQLDRLRNGQPIEQAHLKYLDRRLSRVGRLMAFDEAVSRLAAEEPDLANTYLYEIRAAFTYLAVVYLKREATQTAYFAYLLSKYKICRRMPFDSILSILCDYLKKDSLYCRSNTMRAFYSFGNAEIVADAVRQLDRQDGFYHSKLLTDGLLTFEGDSNRLIALLWEAFDELKTQTQVAILNYIRFQSDAYGDRMLEILRDPARDRELRYAAIRYFGRYPFEPARSLLLDLAGLTDPVLWEYAAFAAMALAAYPGADTVAALKRALHSANWYVRYNAAQSLEALGVTYQEMMDIMNGSDRYAREMMLYRLDGRELRRPQEERRPVQV